MYERAAMAAREWGGGGLGLGIFLILHTEIVLYIVLFIPFCAVNWLDVEALNIEVGS